MTETDARSPVTASPPPGPEPDLARRYSGLEHLLALAAVDPGFA